MANPTLQNDSPVLTLRDYTKRHYSFEPYCSMIPVRGCITMGWSTVPDNHESATDFGREEPRYRVDFEFDHGIQFIREHHQNPFCLIVSFRPPHTPWTAPRENCERFQGKVQYPTYYAMVNRIDENRMVDVLNALGLEQNTLIVYTSVMTTESWTRRAEFLCLGVRARRRPGAGSLRARHSCWPARTQRERTPAFWQRSMFIFRTIHIVRMVDCPPESDPTMFERCIVTKLRCLSSSL